MPFIGTAALEAITNLTHQDGCKTTWPGDDSIREEDDEEEILALAEVLVDRTSISPRVLRAVNDLVDDTRNGYARRMCVYPGQESWGSCAYLAGVKWE